MLNAASALQEKTKTLNKATCVLPKATFFRKVVKEDIDPHISVNQQLEENLLFPYKSRRN